MAVTESELADSFSRIGEDASDKAFIGKCEHTRMREEEIDTESGATRDCCEDGVFAC